MANELATLEERISEKIGQSLIEVIPQEQWDQLMNKQIHKFMNEDAPKIIQRQLEKLLMQNVEHRLSLMSMSTDWNEVTQQNTNKMVESFIKNGAAEFFAAMMAPAVSAGIQNLRSEVASRMEHY